MGQHGTRLFHHEPNLKWPALASQIYQLHDCWYTSVVVRTGSSWIIYEVLAVIPLEFAGLHFADTPTTDESKMSKVPRSWKVTTGTLERDVTSRTRVPFNKPPSWGRAHYMMRVDTKFELYLMFSLNHQSAWIILNITHTTVLLSSRTCVNVHTYICSMHKQTTPHCSTLDNINSAASSQKTTDSYASQWLLRIPSGHA